MTLKSFCKYQTSPDCHFNWTEISDTVSFPIFNKKELFKNADLAAKAKQKFESWIDKYLAFCHHNNLQLFRMY